MYLVEVFYDEARILEQRRDKDTMQIAVKWQHVDKINNNKRLYRRAIIEREIARLQPLIAQGAVFGCGYHPKESAGDVNDVSHIWRSARIEKDGSCVGVIDILPTVIGKNAQIILRNGGRIGLSSRGTGTTTKKKMEDPTTKQEIEYDDVNDDYTLKTPGDFALSPSVPDAAAVREQLERFYNNSDHAALDGSERLDPRKVLFERYMFAVSAGYKGSFAHYKETFRKKD